MTSKHARGSSAQDAKPCRAGVCRNCSPRTTPPRRKLRGGRSFAQFHTCIKTQEREPAYMVSTRGDSCILSPRTNEKIGIVLQVFVEVWGGGRSAPRTSHKLLKQCCQLLISQKQHPCTSKHKGKPPTKTAFVQNTTYSSARCCCTVNKGPKLAPET